MLKSLRSAEQSMLIQQLRMETLANNLANVNSTAFKQILTQVTEEAAPGALNGGAVALANKASTRQAEASRSLGTAQLRAVLDTRPGPLRPTGTPTDLAILGEGFFVVETPDGERYTRDGAFALDSQRRLVTGEGQAVQGSGGPLVIEGGEFTVARDGSVTAAGAEVGRLKIVRFADAARLQHGGGGLLSAPPDMPAEEISPDQVHVGQGQLEGSNVSPIETLVDMIAAQRAFEMATKVIQSADQTLDRSVNDLGRTR